MASKPTVLPRWGNVSGDITTPTSGKQDLGWEAGEKPAAQYANWLAKNTYDFLAWLDQGTFELSDSLAPTALSGNVNNYNPTGLADVGRLFVKGGSGGDYYHITGIESGDVPGRVLALIVDPTANGIYLDHQSGSSSATNRFHCPEAMNLFLPPGSAVFLVYDDNSDDWHIIGRPASCQHGDRIKRISHLNLFPADFATAQGATDETNLWYAVLAATSGIYLPLDFNKGDRVKSFSYSLFGDAADDLTVTVYKVYDDGTAPASIGTHTITDPAASWATQTLDVTDTELDGTFSLLAKIVPSAATGLLIKNFRVTFDHPKGEY